MEREGERGREEGEGERGREVRRRVKGKSGEEMEREGR